MEFRHLSRLCEPRPSDCITACHAIRFFFPTHRRIILVPSRSLSLSLSHSRSRSRSRSLSLARSLLAISRWLKWRRKIGVDRRRRALAAARFIICVSETVAVTAYNTGQNRENLRLRRRISVVLRSANYTITTNSTCTFCFDLSIFSVKNEITMEAKLKFDQMENIDKYIYTLFSTFPITSPIERNTTKRALFAVVRRRPGLVFAVLRYRKH